jgi:hypothetical protein
MPHLRIQIRRRVSDRLKATVDVGGRVFTERPEPVFEGEMPVALVYYTNEAIVAVNAAQDTYDRRLTMNVDLLHKVRQGIDDFLDRLAWQVEQTMLEDTTLGDLDGVDNVKLVSSVPLDPDADGEQVAGLTRLTFEIDYHSYVYVPNATDEFLNFGEKIDAPIGDGATIEFNQTIRSE